jgi:putative two-component system response regulator
VERFELVSTNAKPTILVVDDTPTILALIGDLLQERYKIKVATTGERALQIAASSAPPDLILLDIVMPNMDGYEVCRRLKSSSATRDIPIIFLTARSSTGDEERGLELGAVDYIVKPISPLILRARVRTHLMVKVAQDFLRDQNRYLESEVQRRTAETRAVQEVTIHVLASLAETRDTDTGYHIRRTQHYVKLLAEALRKHPRFSGFLDDDATIEQLFKSAPLHDIGKVGIPDHILRKPGRLEFDEFETMKTHTTLGRDAIVQAERELGLEMPFLKIAKEIALGHHEKWLGGGYPDGLKNEEIPISARLMAVADVYDALISRRVYKEANSHEDAVNIISGERGKQFDPDVADAFLEIQEKFRQIAEKYSDSPPVAAA